MNTGTPTKYTDNPTGTGAGTPTDMKAAPLTDPYTGTPSGSGTVAGTLPS